MLPSTLTHTWNVLSVTTQIHKIVSCLVNSFLSLSLSLFLSDASDAAGGSNQTNQDTCILPAPPSSKVVGTSSQATSPVGSAAAAATTAVHPSFPLPPRPPSRTKTPLPQVSSCHSTPSSPSLIDSLFSSSPSLIDSPISHFSNCYQSSLQSPNKWVSFESFNQVSYYLAHTQLPI